MNDFPLELEHLFADQLPNGSCAAVDALRSLEALTVRKQHLSYASADLQIEAQAAYARLLAEVTALERSPKHAGSHVDNGLRFAESVLLWMQFCKTSSSPLIDSLGTSSLRSFPIDLPPDASAFQRLRQALGRSQGLSTSALAEAERRVQHLTSSLELKLRLTAALQRRLEAVASDPQRFVSLMRAFYGDLPLRSSDVDFVLTSTGVFFVLPVDGEQLGVPDYADRPESDRATLRAFLQRLARGNLTETWRFPAFGLFDLETLDPALVAELSAETGVRADVIQSTLITMVSILPKAEIDQYLVHDAWGHTWQEVLNEFEWEYALLRAVQQPLAPEDGPAFGGADVAPLGNSFYDSDGVTRLDAEALVSSARADLQGRIQVGLSAALSEVLADFVEAKFSRMNPLHPLPTSSLLDARSLKFDLTLQDVLRQARRWSRPYRHFLEEAEELARWRAQLAARGLPDNGLTEALNEARAVLAARLGPALRPELAGGSSGPAGSTTATRSLLKLAQLCHELEHVLGETLASRASPAWTEPARCPDLWAVSVSHLYEADRQRQFWQLDYLVREPLLLSCEALGRELAH